MITMEEKKTEWVSTRYLAEALEISPTRARKLVKDEDLQIFVVGSRWKIWREDADRAIAEVRERGWL